MSGYFTKNQTYKPSFFIGAIDLYGQEAKQTVTVSRNKFILSFKEYWQDYLLDSVIRELIDSHSDEVLGFLGNDSKRLNLFKLNHAGDYSWKDLRFFQKNKESHGSNSNCLLYEKTYNELLELSEFLIVHDRYERIQVPAPENEIFVNTLHHLKWILDLFNKDWYGKGGSFLEEKGEGFSKKCYKKEGGGFDLESLDFLYHMLNASKVNRRFLGEDWFYILNFDKKYNKIMLMDSFVLRGLRPSEGLGRLAFILPFYFDINSNDEVNIDVRGLDKLVDDVYLNQCEDVFLSKEEIKALYEDFIKDVDSRFSDSAEWKKARGINDEM